jgi:8-oxo-dGTP pyrophosphatase MutT (NUDIX family)
MRLAQMFPSAFSSYKPRHQKVYGCICISSNDRILLVKGKLSGKWSIPKGHMEQCETDIQCALRELREETGIIPADTYSSYKKFSAGGYFIFYMNDEPTPLSSCNYTEEIEEVGWFYVNELSTLNCNVDLSLFRKWIRKPCVRVG